MIPDWAAKPTNVPYASFGDPRSLNLYSYANNNPTTIGDPDGHCDWCWDLVLSATTFVVQHPEISNAIDKVGSSLGIKASLGVGLSGSVGAAKGEASATGYVSIAADKGPGAGLEGKVGGRVGAVGGEIGVDAPVLKDGQLVNPLKNTTISGAGTITVGGDKSSGAASVDGEKTSVGGNYGEGVVGGVEVSTGTNALTGVLSAVGNAIASDVKQFVNDVKGLSICGMGGCSASGASGDEGP